MYIEESTYSRGLKQLPVPKNSVIKHGPRERAAQQGIRSLSDLELVMTIIGSGTSSNPVRDLAAQVLPLVVARLPDPVEPKALEEIHGIGAAKAAAIAGSMELARRYYAPVGTAIRSPADLHPLIAHFGASKQEHFLSIPLNGAHEVIGVHVVSVGLVNRTMVHPREVFAPAIEARAVSLIVAHNHPSGKLEPSNEDQQVTLRLKECGEILGISLLDHMIFSDIGFRSFLELGQI